MMKPTPLTQQGYTKMEAELNYLRTVRRAELAARLNQARESGTELIENAEYEDAKNEQSFVEGRIEELEQILANAVLITLPDEPDGDIQLGSLVTVMTEDGDTETYLLVGPIEANPREGRISDACPLGRALKGRLAGEEVSIRTPDGLRLYKILAVECGITDTLARIKPSSKRKLSPVYN